MPRPSQPGFLLQHDRRVFQRCHALPQHLARRLCWIVQLQHGEAIDAVLFSPPAGSLVGIEGADMPRPDLKDVLHGGTLVRMIGNTGHDPKEIQQSSESQWRQLPLAKRRTAHAGVLPRDLRQADLSLR